MYHKILVPLDGSKVAEAVLDHVIAIASGPGKPEVVLVTVTEKIKVKMNPDMIMPSTGRNAGVDQSLGDVTLMGQVPGDVDTLIGEFNLQEPAWTRAADENFTEHDEYLEKIQEQLKKSGLKVRTEVLIGKPAEAIVDYAKQVGIDLIIICSHGHSGSSFWPHGSVADKVLRASSVAVLMVRALAHHG